ncbi:MAG: ribosomal L7Ae/L30e/S12e/Gadd45 family protein [Clostridiaceae bacterium]|nr:ribosomal L7Ae/L30e/S12e/Gadd45 family protein [Clostridiaceae bacterium]
MLSALATTKKVTGLKQTKRAIVDGRAASVYIAEDAEMRLRLELSNLCREHDIPQIMIESMIELGHACGLRIGASSAAVLR